VAVKSRTEACEYVLKIAKEQDVKFIRLWFTDILGFLKSFAITFEELEAALEDGVGFDGPLGWRGLKKNMCYLRLFRKTCMG
jgi:glutamine synthetase